MLFLQGGKTVPKLFSFHLSVKDSMSDQKNKLEKSPQQIVNSPLEFRGHFT